MISAAQEMAKEKNMVLADKEIEFVVGFGEDLSRFADGSVDLVVAGESSRPCVIGFVVPDASRFFRSSSALVRDAQSLSRAASSTETERLLRFLGQSFMQIVTGSCS